MGRLVLGVSIEGDFLVTRLQVGSFTGLVPEQAIGYNKRLHRFDTRRIGWPVIVTEDIGPPPVCILRSGPGDTVILRRGRACLLILRLCKEGKNRCEMAAHEICPRSLPHCIQAAAIARTLPRSSGETGSSPVIARNAQNQCPGLL